MSLHNAFYVAVWTCFRNNALPLTEGHYLEASPEVLLTCKRFESFPETLWSMSSTPFHSNMCQSHLLLVS